jgi:2,4-dienoyl-CoA reductase (NADPH2)
MTKKIIVNRLKNNKVRILTGHRLNSVTDNGVVVVDDEGKESFISGDSVIIAVGNRPDNSLFEQVKSIGVKEVYQIGDCLEARSAKEAIFEGASIGRKL